MKCLGAIMILAGCLGLGYRYTCRLSQRIRLLEEMLRILELVEGEVAYGRATLPECMLFAGQQTGGEISNALVRVGERSLQHPGESFGKLLRLELDRVLMGNLDKGEQEAFYRLVTPLGYEEDAMLTRALKRSIRELDEAVEQLKQRRQEKCRVALSLGGLGGILLVILLV